MYKLNLLSLKLTQPNRDIQIYDLENPKKSQNDRLELEGSHISLRIIKRNKFNTKKQLPYR